MFSGVFGVLGCFLAPFRVWCNLCCAIGDFRVLEWFGAVCWWVWVSGVFGFYFGFGFDAWFAIYV